MEIKQEISTNNNEIISHNKGLLKYHQTNYDNLEKELEAISFAYSVHSSKKRFLIGTLATILAVGMSFSIVGEVFVGLGALFFTGTCLQGYYTKKKVSIFMNRYPSYVHLLQEKSTYLMEMSSDIKKEKDFQQSEITHLQTQITQLEQELSSEKLNQKEPMFRSEKPNIVYSNVVDYEKQKRKIKNKNLRYHY